MGERRDQYDVTDSAELFKLHGTAVYRRARRLLGTHHDAEEATQEVFLRVLKHGEAFEARSSVTTWLYEVTTNLCLNLLRDQQARRKLWATHVAPSAETAGGSSGADALTDVRALLAGADPDDARAVVYVYLDGMSHDEAAAVLGVSRRTVGNRLDRFRAWADEQTRTPTEGRAPLAQKAQ